MAPQMKMIDLSILTSGVAPSLPLVTLDQNQFNNCRNTYRNSMMKSTRNIARRKRTIEQSPKSMMQSLFSFGVSAAYCNEETLSSSFLILDGVLTISLGAISSESDTPNGMMNEATTRWGQRVETNICVGKVSYNYRWDEEEEKGLDHEVSNNASVLSQTLVLTPLGVDPDPTETRDIDPDRYLPPAHKMVADTLMFHEYDETVEVYKEILETDKERYGDNDLVCAIDCHNLGVANLLCGNHDDALQCFQESVLLKRECLDKNDNLISDSLVEIGIILYSRGDLEGALRIFKEAFSMYSKDPSSPDKVGRTLNNIGCVYFAMGDLSAALLCLQKALDSQKVTLGLNTKAESALLNFALTLSNIGHIKAKQNQPDSLAPLEESLLVLESVLGDDNTTVESTRVNIAKFKQMNK